MPCSVSSRPGSGARRTPTDPTPFALEAPDFLHLPEPGTSREPPTFGLPLRRLRPPLPLQVEVNHRAPVQVTSGTIRGSVRAARGPYQLLGGWWGPEGWTCEEWDVELVQGGLYRVSRQPEGWFLEGTYD